MPKKQPPPAMPEPLTPEDVEHIRQIWLKGVSIAEIAEKFEQTREFIWGVLEGSRLADEEMPRIRECSFCPATQHERNLLLAGARALICEKCVEVAMQIILEERPELVSITIGSATPEDTSTNESGAPRGQQKQRSPG